MRLRNSTVKPKRGQAPVEIKIHYFKAEEDFSSPKATAINAQLS